LAQRRTYALVLLLVGLVLVAGVGVGWWGLKRFLAPQMKIVLRGSSGSSGRLGISGGDLVVVAPKPGVFFGTVRKPGTPEQLTYVILFRYGRSKSGGGGGHGVQFSCKTDARSAQTTDAIELNGQRIEAAYRVELDEALTGVTSETLTIGGKPVDAKSGRVFLMDLAADAPAYRQKTADLPPIPAKLETTADVERLADAIREGLERQDPEIKAFLR